VENSSAGTSIARPKLSWRAGGCVLGLWLVLARGSKCRHGSDSGDLHHRFCNDDRGVHFINLRDGSNAEKCKGNESKLIGAALGYKTPCEEFPDISLDAAMKSFWEKRADDYMDEQIVSEGE
jgi:hypothetical protein